MNRTNIRVLLVEDNDAHAELISRAFEPRNALMQLDVVNTLQKARAAMQEAPPDLVLIDLILPDGRGTDLLPSEEQEAPFPFVIMTSHGDEEVAVEALKGGALHYVVKSWETLAEMPQIVDTALREWGHVVERRRAEKALQLSEEHFRSLIENALDIIMVLDEDGSIRYASPSIERNLGFSPGEKEGSKLYDTIHEDDRKKVAQKIRKVFAEPRTTQFLEYRDFHKDGSLRFFEATTSTHRQSTGPRRAVINSRDVTDRKQAEEERKRLKKQLMHSQKWEIIGTLAGGIANEFNNMLTPILGFATLARDEAPEGSKVERRLDHILTAANRSKALADQLLVLSRQTEPQREMVRLHEVVHEVSKLLRPSIPPTVELNRGIFTDRDTVHADPDQMAQMLMNLCTNAYHAMPDGGVLDVELDALEMDESFDRLLTRPGDGTYVRLRVRDTGSGMDESTLQRALEPFFTTKGNEERSGLGLSVTHSIVVNHGGDLWLESAPGRGTTVHVYLPLAEP